MSEKTAQQKIAERTNKDPKFAMPIADVENAARELTLDAAKKARDEISSFIKSAKNKRENGEISADEQKKLIAQLTEGADEKTTQLIKAMAGANNQEEQPEPPKEQPELTQEQKATLEDAFNNKQKELTSSSNQSDRDLASKLNAVGNANLIVFAQEAINSPFDFLVGFAEWINKNSEGDYRLLIAGLQVLSYIVDLITDLAIDATVGLMSKETLDQVHVIQKKIDDAEAEARKNSKDDGKDASEIAAAKAEEKRRQQAAELDPGLAATM